MLAQSVERRAEGCGFDSWGRTNTQGLKKGTPFTLQEAGPLHGSDDHVKILVPFPYPVGEVKILSPIRTFVLNTFTLKKKKLLHNPHLFLLFHASDASVILDLLNDLERRLAGHDISSQVQFVVNKSKEIMATAAGTTGQGSSDSGSSSGRPKSQLFSLNPLNVPVQLLNLKKPSPVNTASKATPETTKEQS